MNQLFRLGCGTNKTKSGGTLPLLRNSDIINL